MAKYHYSAVISGPRKIRVEKSATQRTGRKQVKVQLEGCGVCGSNLPVWEGRPWFKYPLEAGAPGHEGWGIVDEVGDEVESVRVGERVAVLSYHAFGEVELADEKLVVPLPAKLTGMDFPGEALGCGMNIFRRADIQSGQTVAVVGAGFLGSLLVQLINAAGAKVIAISRRHASLESARRMGASHILPLEDHRSVIDAVSQITSGNFCERVIEATGHQSPLNLAGELCAERGKLVIAGYHQDGLRQVNMQLWNWRGLDVVNAHERNPQTYLDGMKAAVEGITAGTLDPSSLFTHRFRLRDLPDAFSLLSSRTDGFMKALLTYD
jgi:2-desacetyl-2-hydroxyethyl bacteriochlorophyllide A dehydrogenase